MFILLMLYTYS